MGNEEEASRPRDAGESPRAAGHQDPVPHQLGLTPEQALREIEDQQSAIASFRTTALTIAGVLLASISVTGLLDLDGSELAVGACNVDATPVG